MSKPEKKQTVMGSALLMSLGTFVSRILGFIRDAAVVALFDRTVTDVFSATFALPNFFRRLLGEGSLSVSFIPVFVDRLHAGGGSAAERELRARKLSHAVLTLLLSVSVTITLALFVFMEPLILAWLGEDRFMAVPGKFELAVGLSRIMIFYLILVTTYAYFMAISQALKKFFLPALAPAFFNLFFIVTIFLPPNWFTESSSALGYAVLTGGVVQLAIVVIQLMKLGYLPRLTFDVRLPGVGLVLRNMAPGMFGLAASQLMNLMNQKFAAGLAEGSMTHVYITNRLLELPQSLIAISIGTALLPTLSQLNSEGKKTEMIQASHDHIRMMLFLSLPSAVGLYLLATPIVSVLFERGDFGADETQIVASLVQIISLMLLFAGFSRVLIPGFYAIKNTVTPAIITTVTVAFHIFLAPQLMQSMGVSGLIWSVTASGLLGLCMGLVFYYRLVGSLQLGALLLHVVKFVPGLLVMAAVTHFGFQIFLSGLSGFLGHRLSLIAGLFLTIAMSAVIYFLVGHIFHLKEAHAVTRRFRRFLPLI